MPFPKIIISFLIALFLIALYAQKSSKKYFTNLSTVDNLSQNSVSHILQDSQGMIWLATNAGLDKHIGNEILHVEGFSKSLVENITFLHDPGGDSMIIATSTNNYRIHKWYNQNVNVQPEHLGKELNNILYLHRINQDYLVFTDSCIALTDKKLEKVRIKKANLNIQSIAAYDNNTFFIGTDNGLFRYDFSKDSLIEEEEKGNTKALSLQKRADAVYLYAAVQKNPSVESSEIFSVRVQSSGELDGRTSITTLPSTISSIYARQDGHLWVGTRSAGLYVFDLKEPNPERPKDHYCIRSNANTDTQALFSSNEINTLYASKDSVIWVGTEGGGVNLFQQKKQTFKFSYTKEAFEAYYPNTTETYNNNVWSIWPYLQGVILGKKKATTVLIGTESNGIIYFDLSRDRILKNILPPGGDLNFDAAETVQKIRPGFNQDFILGTNAGLYRLTLNSGNLPDNYIPIFSKSGNKDFREETGKISLLEYSPKHNNWLTGRKGGDKIHVFDKSVENYRGPIVVPIREKLSFIQPLDTFILVGTTHGLYKVTPSGDSLFPFPGGKTIVKDMHYICAYQDKKTGKIWLGTDKKGLYYYATLEGIVKVKGFDKPEVIYDIHLDNQNHLWFSTNHGIYEYIEESGIFNQYGISDGIQVHEYNGGATAIIGSDSNTIAFGGINGICYFKPDSTTTLLYSTAFKPIIRWRYPSDQDTLRDKSYHTEYINYNDRFEEVKVINLDHKFGYLDLNPMLGDYQNPANNQFLVTLNGNPLSDTKGSYIIPENKFSSTFEFWKPKNLITIRYRSGNSIWLPNSEQELQVIVYRQFLTGENWLWVALIGVITIALYLFIRSWNKVKIIQKKINEISRLEETEAICKKAIQHLIKDLKFDYAVISLVDFDQKKINSRYGESVKRQIPLPSLWIQQSSYPLNHPDVLARAALEKQSIIVARDKIISIGNKDSSKRRRDKGEIVFNREIMNLYGHDKLVRIYVPIVHRSLSSNEINQDNSKDDDITLGVIEVGYLDNIYYKALRIYNKFSKVIQFVFPYKLKYWEKEVIGYWARVKIRTELYVDNLAQPYYKAYIKEQKKLIYKFVENIERESDQSQLDHTGFLQLVLDRMAVKLGSKYGDISLTSYNTENISFIRDTLTYGYTYEDVHDNVQLFEKENRGKEGIVNYVANSRYPYYTGDVAKDGKYIKLLADGRSEMALPMILNEDTTLTGVMNFLSTEHGYFDRILTAIYAKGVKKATDIYLQKKQYNALKAIVLPFDTFTQTEESIYRSMVESLRQYFRSDYISVWIRSSFDSNEFTLSKATTDKFYDLYLSSDFTKASIKTDDKNEKDFVEIIHVDAIENKQSRLYRFAKQPNLHFKSYIILRISIDQKYQAFINVFSKKAISPDEISGYSKAFLDEITKKVGFVTQSNRLLNAVEIVSKSLTERSLLSPHHKVVEQAYNLLPSVDSVVLFPYEHGKPILIKEAIVGGADLPEEDLANKEKPAYFANLILKKGTQWIEGEQQYLDLAYEALKERPNKETFWHKKSLQSVAAVRLDHEDEPLGVMFFNYKVPKKFMEDNSMIFINAFTNFAKVALLNEDFIKRMQAERTRVERENNRLTDIQRSLKIEKEAIQIENKKLSEKMEEMLPRAARTSLFLILQGVNHDVRNYLLKMEIIISKIAKHVSANNRADFEEMVKGLDGNIDNIHNLLKLFDFRESIAKESIDIKEVIKQVVRFFNQGNKWIKFYLKFGEDIPMITCNKSEFSMIIYNLINNSIQAMETGGQKEGRIDIEARFANKHFEVLVEDDGPGIENETVGRIFDLEYTTKKEGLGIGLFFVKKTLEENFLGTIEVNSIKGKKTVMKISIPEYLNYIK